MERKSEKKISSVLSEFLGSNNLKAGYAEYKLKKAWPELLGKNIANATKEMYVKDKILFVKLYSSVMKSELTHIKPTLIERLNEAAGSAVINDIIFR